MHDKQKTTSEPSADDALLDDTIFLPDNPDGPANEDDNISPAVRALMQKYVALWFFDYLD